MVRSRVFRRTSSLSQGLVTRGSRGGGHVQRPKYSRHGESGQNVTPLADQSPHSLAFRPEDERQIAPQVESIDVGPGAIQANDSKALVFKEINETAEIDDPH